MCPRWRRSFQNFLTDMGARPEGKTLDRIDANGNYAPDNCRWATQAEQNRNYSRNRIVVYGGREWIMTDLADHLGVDKTTLRGRILNGWPEERWNERIEPLRVTYHGAQYTLQELSDVLAIDRYTLRRRILDMKWPEERWSDRPLPRNNAQSKGRHLG